MSSGRNTSGRTSNLTGIAAVLISAAASIMYYVWATSKRVDDFPYARNGDSVLIESIVQERSPLLGSESLGWRVVVFLDYQCPGCRELQDTLEALRSRLGDSLAVHVLHFPIASLHPHATASAEAAECAFVHGAPIDAHRALFSLPDSTSSAAITLAAMTGASGDMRGRIQQCIASRETAPVVASHLQTARRMRLRGTPASILNGRVWYGVISGDSLVSLARGFQP